MDDLNIPDDDMPKLSLKQENEFKRMKLELESGAILPDFSGSNMPPEIEGLFLDNIFNFHTAFMNSKQISVYDRIGAPNFKLAKFLSDDELSRALKQIFTKLNDNGIGFEALFEYEERLIYEFVTTELFKMKVDDIRMENMMMHFVYEEFYPNYREDIKRYCEEFWDSFLSADHELFESQVASEIKNTKKLNLFYELFEYFKIIKNVSENIVYDLKKKKATAEINLIFEGYLKGEKEPIIFAGISKVALKFKYGYWHITGVKLVKN